MAFIAFLPSRNLESTRGNNTKTSANNIQGELFPVSRDLHMKHLEHLQNKRI